MDLKKRRPTLQAGRGTEWEDLVRDQYQGVMLGYALAYEALGEEGEDTRALIREDVVELIEERRVEARGAFGARFERFEAMLAAR
mgnify:CR=1 FL=1